MPVVVDNDANFAARAEALVGAAQGYSPVLMVTMGTGIGGGIWIDGSAYRGRGFAGEIGHMKLVPNGRPAPVAKGVVGRRCARAAGSMSSPSASPLRSQLGQWRRWPVMAGHRDGT